MARINHRIRAKEVRVIDVDGSQLGVLPTSKALELARARGVDLVEVAGTASPPVCRVIDFGKYRYEQSKKTKENKKHQHANKVKEVQLRPKIDPHDFKTKLDHAIEFLCEEMKVKVTLRFRGREMAHQDVGEEVVQHFIEALEPFATPDAPLKKMGRNINVMLSPLPRNKRAKNPNEKALETESESSETSESADGENGAASSEEGGRKSKSSQRVATDGAERPSSGFQNNPFDKL